MINKRIMHLDELIRHKKHLLDSCCKLSEYLIENGEEDFALDLMSRSFVHDISKLSKEEFHALDAFDSFSKYNPEEPVEFSEDKMSFLQAHWKNNRHHPEYWDNLSDMEDIDIAEMVCDWHARSVELGNDLLKYVENNQKDRFSFPDDMYEKILFYVSILTK